MVPAGSSTCWSTSVRRWWSGGPTSGSPELTPELVDRLVRGVRDELGGREREVTSARDQALRELLDTKRRLGLDVDPDATAEQES